MISVTNKTLSDSIQDTQDVADALVKKGADAVLVMGTFRDQEGTTQRFIATAGNEFAIDGLVASFGDMLSEPIVGTKVNVISSQPDRFPRKGK